MVPGSRPLSAAGVGFRSTANVEPASNYGLDTRLAKESTQRAGDGQTEPPTVVEASGGSLRQRGTRKGNRRDDGVSTWFQPTEEVREKTRGVQDGHTAGSGALHRNHLFVGGVRQTCDSPGRPDT